MIGNEAKVVLFENGQSASYTLPSKQLRKIGVTLPNQPFEMDEIEIESDADGFIVGYRFRALALPGDSFVEILELDEARQRKRDIIFREFGKTDI